MPIAVLCHSPICPNRLDPIHVHRASQYRRIRYQLRMLPHTCQQLRVRCKQSLFPQYPPVKRMKVKFHCAQGAVAEIGKRMRLQQRRQAIIRLLAPFQCHKVSLLGCIARQQYCAECNSPYHFPAALAWSARNCCRPMSVSGCFNKPRMAPSGQVATCAPASAAFTICKGFRILAARICVSNAWIA